ncbi:MULTISPECIES: MFS transporter [unclassified Cellulomonas]|uniref:MFS transporter n=1 Tax=unclassified Cellulomonas TaxID=2620175 RepID=UPI0019A13BBC|nr:MFS transporter [Cellulomonas sp. ES6]MBD3780819.1 MFS transporter [Micrococcales bacterium]WHP18782.1 MFS transporter [Cellulomonas sp. ES6]
MKNRYAPTAGSVYLYFFLYGMAVIIMSQNSAHLQEQWGSTEGNVLMAISGIGIGKIIGPSFAGFLSDRVGRRFMVLTSLGMYTLFMVGMLVSPTWQVGFALAVWFGLANAIMDVGTYPTLMESYPDKAGSANMLVKAAIAAGQLVLPLIITWLAASGHFWGLPFIGAAVVLVVVFVVMLRVPFPDYKALAAEQKARIEANAESAGDTGAKLGVEGIALVLFGFTATSMFWLAQNSLPSAGQYMAGMSEGSARGLISWYAIGSFAGVFITASLVAKKFRPVTFLIVNPVAAALAYLLMVTVQNATLYPFLAFAIGYFAAGGLFQLTVVVLAEFFPVRKGVVTSMIGLASGLAAFVLPYLSGWLVDGAATKASGYTNVVWVGLVVSVASVLLGVLVLMRHRRVFPRSVAAESRPAVVAA